MIRRIELQLLMNLTARALGVPSRRIWTMPCDDALQAYAVFTRDQLRAGVSDEVLRRMNDEAYRVGRRLRWLQRIGGLLRLSDYRDADSFVRMLYRNIGIQLEGPVDGQLCFRRCFFSDYYTPAVCLAASALDDGIIRGLTGCGHLRFQHRITEGCSCCLATVKQP